MAARPSSRQLWTTKLNGVPRGKDASLNVEALTSLKKNLSSTKPFKDNTQRGPLKHKEGAFSQPFKGLVLGVDPSLRRTGLAVIDYRGSTGPALLHAKALPFKPSITLATCLAEIARAVSSVLDTYPIDHVALEQTIFVQNYQTAQIMGAVRGAIIATVALKGLPVFEYPPLRIKQALTGFGRASKEQLSKTVANILKIPFNFSLDEGDAAAAALCHAFTYKS